LWRALPAALLPAAIVLVAVAALFGAHPGRFIPWWNDEVVYWNEAAIFAEAGLGGGYVTIDETPARAEFFRFGPHGPLFHVLHGSVGWLAGWQPYTPFYIHLALVSAAAFAWVRGSAARTSPAALVLLAGFWPLLLYLPTAMHEPVHFALAFLIALAVERNIRAGSIGGWGALLILTATLARPSWILMVLPLGWPRARRAGPAGIAALCAVAVLATAAAWGTFDAIAAPSPHNSRMLTRAWLESPPEAMTALATTASRNLQRYVALTEEPAQVVFRYFTAGLLVVLLLRSVAFRPRDPAHALAVETALLAVGPVLLLVLLAGEVQSWRDFRVIAPHVFAGLLVLAARARWERWLWCATLGLLPFYYQGFVAFHQERFTSDRGAIAAMREASATSVPFTPGASPWENTMLMHTDQLQFPLLGLPRGLGISYVFDWSNLKPPVKSRYLLLRESDKAQLPEGVRLVPVAATPLGTVYRNEGG
jgi:hypothetical protein